jgi:3-hydroxybutyryl-CoA dehydrogenase
MKNAFAFGDKTLESAVRRVNDIRRVAVIGAGTMGQGIAIDMLHKTTFEVILLDIRDDVLDRARDRLSQQWAREVKSTQIREADAAALEARTSFTQRYEDLAKADIIWEVATERIEVKASIFASIEKVVDPQRLKAVFSNTSSHQWYE